MKTNTIVLLSFFLVSLSQTSASHADTSLNEIPQGSRLVLMRDVELPLAAREYQRVTNIESDGGLAYCGLFTVGSATTLKKGLLAPIRPDISGVGNAWQGDLLDTAVDLGLRKKVELVNINNGMAVCHLAPGKPGTIEEFNAEMSGLIQIVTP